jgi:hypothetical protein
LLIEEKAVYKDAKKRFFTLEEEEVENLEGNLLWAIIKPYSQEILGVSAFRKYLIFI